MKLTLGLRRIQESQRAPIPCGSNNSSFPVVRVPPANQDSAINDSQLYSFSLSLVQNFELSVSSGQQIHSDISDTRGIALDAALWILPIF